MAMTVVIAALSMGALVYQLASRAKAWDAPGTLAVRSSRQPSEILRAARRFFAEAGWTEVARSRRVEAFTNRLRPAGPEVIALLLLGLIPGVLYLLIKRKSVRVTVTCDRDGQGSATLVSWSHGGECEPACRDFASMIHRQEPTLRPRKKRVRTGT